MRTPTIVPFGGMRPTPDLHPIRSFLLEMADKPRPKIALIPTATGDSDATVAGLIERFPPDRAEVRVLRLFNRTVTDIDSFLGEQDIIWVGGGNTASMLAVWRAHGVDVALRRAWESGVILTGASAGSLCWFEAGTTDSFDLATLHPLHDGLGFLPGSHCPHYDGEEQRRPLYHRLISEGFPAGYAADDDAVMVFKGTTLEEVVTARPGATCYRVERGADGAAVETPLEARLLS